MTGIQADPEVVSILLYLRCVSLYCMYMYGSGLLLSGHALEEKKMQIEGRQDTTRSPRVSELDQAQRVCA